MAYEENEVVMLSSIAHYAYCPRRCGLMHVDGEFEDNVYTLQGQHIHERADMPLGMTEEGVKVERALPLWSDGLGLVGKADVVEFHPDGAILPVEYKRSRKREDPPADMQLCAQAMCLEEMFDRAVTRGAEYHASSRERREIVFSDGLRTRVVEMIGAVRGMLKTGNVPPPVNDARCPKCSMLEICMPSAVAALRDAAAEIDLFTPVELEGVE